MKRPEGRRELRPPRAPARFEAEEAAMMQHAREAPSARAKRRRRRRSV